MDCDESAISEELREELTKMCEEFSNEEPTDLQALEIMAGHFFRITGGGEMTRDQFVKACASETPRDELTTRLFDIIAEGRPTIDVCVFLRAVLTLAGKADDQATKANIIFKLFDKDGDGVLTRADLETVAAEFLPGVDKEIISEAVQSTIDAAGGKSITEDEFRSMADNNPWLLTPVTVDWDRLMGALSAE